MEEKHCKWYNDEFCTNDKSPCVADYCPVVQYPDLCKHRETEVDKDINVRSKIVEEMYKSFLREELNDLEYKAYARGVNSFNTLHEKQLEKESKKTATITEQGQADWLDGYKVGFRDGVVALRTQTVEKIDEICKELTEDKV